MYITTTLFVSSNVTLHHHYLANILHNNKITVFFHLFEVFQNFVTRVYVLASLGLIGVLCDV